MKRDRVYNLLATVSLIFAGMVLIYYSIIFAIPQSPINPFRPIEIPIAVVPNEVLATQAPEATLVPISTSTPTSTPASTPTAAPIEPSPTISATLALTSPLARTVSPTTRPTASITLTPDICTTLKLVSPRSGQHYNQNDNADLTWTFGRALQADEHFDVLLDPPGQGISSLVWADEVQPELKNCTTRCTYEVGLGRYPGGRFNWTIGVIKAGSDHQVAAQICKPPDPFNFTYLTLQ